MGTFLKWIIVLTLVGVGVYYFLLAGARADGVQIVFKGPDAIAYGAPFELKVGIGNSSSRVWKNTSLSLSAPHGFVFVNDVGGTEFMVKQMGDVGVGSFTEIPFTVMAVASLAEDGADATATEAAASSIISAFEAQLSYAPESGSAIFEKKEQWVPPAVTNGFELSVAVPEHAASGEEVEIKIAYTNNTGADLDDLALRVTYPPAFVFGSASADPDANDGVWNIGGLKKGSSDTLVIKGRFTAAGTGLFSVSVARSSGFAKYPIATGTASVLVTDAPLAVSMDVNDTPDYVTHLGDTLAYTLAYTMDGLTTPRGGLTMTADLLSPLFDITTVVPADGGIFGRGPDGVPRISWRVAHPDAEGGSVSFSVKVKNDYNIRRLGDRNFTLKVHSEVAAGATVGSLDYETKVMGQVMVAASGYFRDAASGMVNKGTMPPKVGALTEYTIHWKIINYATDVRGVMVRAVLPAGVAFTGVIKSNVDGKPVYDPATREVVWRIDRISATTGLIGTAPEAVFQLSSVPDAGMRGKNAPLLGVTDVSATDDFTGVVLHATAPEITTALPNDTTASGHGIVE